MIGMLTHNLGWKLLSLAAAFLIWLSIASEPDLATVVSAPVEYRNFPRDLEISSEIVDSINIDTRGPATELRDLRNAHLSAIVDFASVNTPGERTFTLTARELNLPRGVELIRTIPAQLRFTFERRSSRELHVEVPTTGHLPPGLRIAGMKVFPPVLSIMGPESRVAAARDARADPLDISDLKAGDSERQLAVYVAEPEVRFMGKPQVTVKIHVESNH